MQPDPIILREYDIRGTYGKNLFDRDARWLGECFGSLVYKNGGRKVVLGRDGRSSSPALYQHLSQALIESGLEVMDIGVGPTPMTYFAGYALNADATLMITGSHNPKDDNGIKMTFGNKPFFGAQIQALLQELVVKNTGGTSQDLHSAIFEQYSQRLLQRHHFKKPLKIAWDAGNGAAGPIIEKLTKALSEHTHTLLFCDIDRDFPNHHPDPSVRENLEHLVDAISAHGCDIGFAFDGDGDRIGVVDSSGRILAGDELIAILSKALLAEAPGGTIIADVKCSNNTFHAIAQAGGQPIMGKTGHSWVKQAMVEHNAIFAGEMSGHMFFKHSYYGYDDALFAALFLIDYAQTIGGSFADLISTLPILHATPEIRMPCAEAQKASIIEALKLKISNSSKNYKLIDGVRVEEPYGWWLVRASHTQSVLIIRAEGNSPSDLERIISDMRSFGIDISAFY